MRRRHNVAETFNLQEVIVECSVIQLVDIKPTSTRPEGGETEQWLFTRTALVTTTPSCLPVSPIRLPSRLRAAPMVVRAATRLSARSTALVSASPMAPASPATSRARTRSRDRTTMGSLENRSNPAEGPAFAGLSVSAKIPSCPMKSKQNEFTSVMLLNF